MGSSQSSTTMDVRDILLSIPESDGSDSETDYADIFQRLIRRYTNQMSVESFGNNILKRHKRPKIRGPPNTTLLDSSEFCQATKMNSGLGTGKVQTTNNVAALLKSRECGMENKNSFSKAQKCRINNNYIPNKMELLYRFEGKAFCGMFSGDGEFFISATQEQIIRIYRIINGAYKLIQKFNAMDVGWSIIDVAISPNNEHFVYSTWSTSIHMCSVNGNPMKQQALNLVHTARRFCVFSLVYSSDGTKILGGANDGVMFLYDLEKNKRTLKIPAHDYDVNTVKFADYSSHIIYSGSDDGLIKVWDRRTLDEEEAKPVGILAGHHDGVTYIDAKGDGRYLISNSKDQTIKLWDVRKFSSQAAAADTIKAVHNQTWDYRWQGVPNRLSNMPKINGDTSVMTYRGHVITRTLVRCKFSPIDTTGQRYIYTGCGTGRLIIYDALTGIIQLEDRKHSACVRDVSWHPHYNEILTSSWDGTVGRWYYHGKTCEANETEGNTQNTPLRRSERIAKQHSQERNRCESDNNN